MRLHIAHNRTHQKMVERVFPEDKVVCYPDRVAGLRVENIVVWQQPERTADQWDHYHRWFDEEVLCRMEPTGTVFRA